MGKEKKVFEKLTTEEFTHLVEANEASVRVSTNPSNSAFISSLVSVEKDLLAQLMVEVKCEPGSVIFREGDSGTAVYLIRAGQVVAIKGSLSDPIVLGCRGPGEVIGEMALLDNRPRSASVIALDEMRLFRIDDQGFHQLLQSSPAASLSVMKSLSARLREATRVRDINDQIERHLSNQLNTLQHENLELMSLQQVRQETADLVIHDLRNPLSLMYGAFQMLEMLLPQDVVKSNWELFDVINTSYTRMRRLVDSLLDVARMDAGDAPLDISFTTLKELIDEAVVPATFSLKRRNIEFITEIPTGMERIKVDQDKIVRVLGNLLDNAVKHMPSGGHLIVAAERKDDFIEISVTDSGPGIPKDDRERIFERFSQVIGDKRPRGFGLGLVFCKLTVEAHGGRIWVEPGPDDVGCRFAFTIRADTND